jgi:hypothetical protein
MNRTLRVGLVAAIALGVVPYALSIGTPSPPPGISADKWVAMGDAAGFVITDVGNDLRNGLRSEPNTMRGYFMVRHKDSWVRVDVSPGYETRPAAFAH